MCHLLVLNCNAICHHPSSEMDWHVSLFKSWNSLTCVTLYSCNALMSLSQFWTGSTRSKIPVLKFIDMCYNPNPEMHSQVAISQCRNASTCVTIPVLKCITFVTFPCLKCIDTCQHPILKCIYICHHPRPKLYWHMSASPVLKSTELCHHLSPEMHQ